MSLMARMETLKDEKPDFDPQKKNTMQALTQLVRPRQWVKNSFVFIGLLFTQNLNQHLILKVIIAAVAFCLVSSAVYVMNDFVDRDYDRNHPIKRKRPLASNRVTLSAAGSIFALFLLGGLFLGWHVSKIAAGILVLYVAQNLAYTKGLKRIVLVDVFIIALGFMLRILMGTWGVGIPPSEWLLLCGFMVALFMGFGKRCSELNELNADAGLHRPVLERYSSGLLNQLLGITAGGVIFTYSLYTLDSVTVALHHTTDLIYSVPFVIYGIFRYLYLIHKGEAGDPSKLVTKDRHLIAVVMLWVLYVLWTLKLHDLVLGVF